MVCFFSKHKIKGWASFDQQGLLKKVHIAKLTQQSLINKCQKAKFTQQGMLRNAV